LSSRDLGYIRDIRDAANRAINHIIGLDAELIADTPSLQDGVVRCLILMGEAARNLSPAVREQFPRIDWPGMIGLRNILVHRYQEIDYMQLWTIVNRDLDPVIEQLSAYLKEHG
jgi:uncharacterized protein with HEPN domain